MHRYERAQVVTLAQRLLREPPERIVALFGPRQSGKTTIVDQALARYRRETARETLYRAADAPEAVRGGGDTRTALPGRRRRQRLGAAWITRHWNDARARAERGGGCVLVFDEIQVIPCWSSVVKGLWDADRDLRRRPQVVILGSAPLSVQPDLAENLAGRFEPLSVPFWSLHEMEEAFGFDLQRYLYFGSYPGAAGLAVEGREDQWRAVVLDGCLRPIIGREIVALTRVDEPALMKHLFEMGAHYSGRIVSSKELLGYFSDAKNATMLSRYLALLEAVGFVAGLSGYATGPPARRSSRKLLALNPAVLTTLSRFDFRDALEDRAFWGRVVESAVGAHLFQTRRASDGLYYWRAGNAEVDFVLERGHHLLAIEVESGARGAHAGFAAFRAKYPHARRLLVGDSGVPVAEFLSEPAERWLTGKR